MGNPSVLLINPAIANESQNRRINAVVNRTFPTSLGVLAGYLTGNGVEGVSLIDEQIYPISDSDLPQLINSMPEPRVFGLSVLTINSGSAYMLADKIKSHDPRAIVILGGIHPTVLPEEPFAESKGVDIVVRGEGEETLLKLVVHIAEGRDWRALPGLSFPEDGVIKHNPDSPLIASLDDIPPFPYHLFEADLASYPTFAGVIGSRGCPYKCAFCSSRSISGTRYRYHSVARVVSEIKTLVRKYKQESVHLMDDNIAVNKKHFAALCEAIVGEGLHKEAFFHGSLRGDNASDDVLDMAKKANFKILYFGLETGNERLMKVVNKGETLAQIVDGMTRAAARGFSVGATVIFGLPTETRKERYEIMRFVHGLPLASVRFNALVPYPGTPFFDQEFPKGNILIKKNWSNFGVQFMWESDDIPYVPEGNSRLELIFDTMFANLYSYLSPKGLKRAITQRYAGGNVIKLEKDWFLSIKELRKMGNAFLYLISRFTSVAARIVLRLNQ
jgi:anaerobic magnesium-protoporphyrin IX monomethyl ester cyclase